ncbi:MAG: cysteine--tRNA ligase [Devosia sp.]|uniref:cysteine--tRNA ligase n=1 Tax=Devosia sp. TaxID=1871048 RepID=UPI001A4FEAB4|nr:cysteine--tRNA ligase [Devosia sp.]MBL8599398.1 cysteine--tRNA ligase [Devosia sp.]
MGSDVTLKLHNTLTRTREDFVPLDPNNVRMYVCGPTVYDFAHIGNARPAIVFDVLFRLLRHVYGADHVTYVRNITDVDDKINARAARDYPNSPLNEAIRKVTETTAAQYQKDTTALGCLQPTVQPRATENIDEMQRIIASLQQRGHAYEAGGEVLFAVETMDDYGALSGRDLSQNLAGARVEVDAHKRNPADFVLWKLSSASEPGWDSPWGRGRPGWHIECSAMSERYLGQVFDIHAGGLDLIFPHHENEIAQSRCAHGTETMARYWLHNGFLQVEGQKMSKSLGNFITINELLETDRFGGRSWPGEVLRLAMLMTHYREPIDFTVKRVEEAEDKLRSWQRTASSAKGTGTPDASVIEALADELNFHRASVAMDVIARKANRGVETAVECLAATLEFFGFSKDCLLSDALVFDHSRVEDAVQARLAALNAKDFAKADEIRSALLAEGIQLMDSKNDAGERVTKWEIKR